jgi:hemin uptake protein HemP
MTEHYLLLCDRMSDTSWTDIPVHRSITSNDLMAGERVIIIQHGQEEYRLRLTASGKLMLTK